MNHRKKLDAALKAYEPHDAAEAKHAFALSVLPWLTDDRILNSDFYEPGHITAAAVAVNEDRTHALVVHDPVLNLWIFPGGHIDGNCETRDVAMHWLEKLTGIAERHTMAVTGIFDIDHHPIPAVAATPMTPAVPEHWHYCIRHRVIVRNSAPQPHSSIPGYKAKWMTLDTLKSTFPVGGGRARVVGKLEALRQAHTKSSHAPHHGATHHASLG